MNQYPNFIHSKSQCFFSKLFVISAAHFPWCVDSLIAMFYPRKLVMIALTFEGMVDHSIDTFCGLENHLSTGVIP